MKKHTWNDQLHSGSTSSWSKESDTTAYFVGYHPTFAKKYFCHEDRRKKLFQIGPILLGI